MQSLVLELRHQNEICELPHPPPGAKCFVGSSDQIKNRLLPARPFFLVRSYHNSSPAPVPASSREEAFNRYRDPDVSFSA